MRTTFSESISNLRLGWDELHLGMSFYDKLTNKVIINLNVLVTIVKNKIGGKIGGRNVITKETNGYYAKIPT